MITTDTTTTTLMGIKAATKNKAPFGLVDEQELEYFKQAESTLTVDAFGSSEERRGFVSSVFEESKGKELKLVTNHICSRLIERLILLANDRQVLDLLRHFLITFQCL